MAQELEQDVLLTSEEGSDNLKVVSGVDDNGNLKTVAAKQQHEADFLKFDRHSNMLESFLKNYFAQAKNPKHTGIYRVAAEGVENISQMIGNLLSSGGEEGKEFLQDYQIDSSKYQQGQTQGENTEVKREYGYDPEKIDWDMFAKIGVSRESLEKSGALDQMLRYNRSPELIPITMNIDGLTVNTDARLSLRRTDDDRLIPVVHAVRKEPQLDRPYYGNTFTQEDKNNLLTTGNLGRAIELDFKGSNQKVLSFVSIDSKTNELVAYSAKNLRVPNEIKGVKLDDEQRNALLQGKSIYLEGMQSKSGKEFGAHIQINAAERGLTFRFDNQHTQQQSANQSQKQGEVRIPNKLGGVALSPEDQETLRSGKVLYVEGMTDKKGEKYNAYIRVNSEMGKLDFYKWDPRKKQGVTPDNNSTTQVAVNSEGKTN
ncbi:MAG: DUF3945 domain-containing protein, partial [Rikenellaceae bacterium]